MPGTLILIIIFMRGDKLRSVRREGGRVKHMKSLVKYYAYEREGKPLGGKETVEVNGNNFCGAIAVRDHGPLRVVRLLDLEEEVNSGGASVAENDVVGVGEETEA